MQSDENTQVEEFNNNNPFTNEDEAETYEAEETEENESEEESSSRVQELEAELAKARRMLEQKNRKLQKVSENKGKAPKQNNNADEIGYAEKAFLVANGFKGADEFKIIQEVMSVSGKSLEEVIENKYVLSQIKDLREYKATSEATPSSSKRAGASSKTQVDYWLAKGELPPTDQVQLRRDVVNARLKQSQQKNKFGA